MSIILKKARIKFIKAYESLKGIQNATWEDVEKYADDHIKKYGLPKTNNHPHLMGEALEKRLATRGLGCEDYANILGLKKPLYSIDKYNYRAHGVFIVIDGHLWLHQCVIWDGELHNVIDARTGLPSARYRDIWDGEDGIPAEYQDLAKKIIKKEIHYRMIEYVLEED